MGTRAFLITLFFVFPAKKCWSSEEVSTASPWEAINNITSNDDDTEDCSQEEQVQRKNILKSCRENWKAWGIAEAPKAKELLNPKRCFTEKKTVGTVVGACVKSLLALPIMLGDLYIMSLVAAIPVNKKSFAYVSQKGNLQDMQMYYADEFARRRCQLAAGDEKDYVAKKCAHHANEPTPDCNKYLEEVRVAQKCRRTEAFAQDYQNKKSEILAEAQKLYEAQQLQKKLSQEHKHEVAALRQKCGVYLNKYSATYAKIFENPISYLYTGARQRVSPNSDDVAKFNQCVYDNAKNKKEFIKQLEASSSGLVGSIAGQIQALKCYREDIQYQTKCDIAAQVLGVSNLASKSAVGVGKNFLLKLAPSAAIGKTRLEVEASLKEDLGGTPTP